MMRLKLSTIKSKLETIKRRIIRELPFPAPPPEVASAAPFPALAVMQAMKIGLKSKVKNPTGNLCQKIRNLVWNQRKSWNSNLTKTLTCLLVDKISFHQ